MLPLLSSRSGDSRRISVRNTAILVGASLFLTACYDRPEQPSLMRDIAMVDEQDFTYPHVPPLRTSADGRIGLSVEGDEGNSDVIRLYLMAPEKLESPIVKGDNGVHILSDTMPYGGKIDRDYEDGLDRYGLAHPISDMTRPDGSSIHGDHSTLCDVRPDLLNDKTKANPYACGSDGKNDCYDLTHITYEYSVQKMRLIGTPLTIEVEKPKTADAVIADVQVGEPVFGPELFKGGFFEPMVTWDGRLLSGRRISPNGIFDLTDGGILEGLQHTWTNPRTGEQRRESYEVMYSVLPEEADPCDVTQWQNFHPISYAHHDPDMQDYGLAQFPLRDSTGTVMEEGMDFGASYPWIDRSGDNIFFATHRKKISNTPSGMFPTRCVDGGSCDFSPLGLTMTDPTTVRGHAVAGLWTQGKMVVIDNLLNNSDWNSQLLPEQQWMVTLYDEKGAQENPIEVQVGGGRQIKLFEDERMPAGWTGNAGVMDSLENIFNYHEALKPVTPRDVVWVISKGQATAEFAFDDYMDPDAFILSNMAAAVTPNVVLPQHVNGMKYHDGLTNLLPLGIKTKDAWVQNAAAAPADRWLVPDYGRVTQGARIEPVSLGGIEGRGFWMHGENGLEYEIKPQPRDVRDHDWYIGLFIDTRFDNDNEERLLIRFSDKSELRTKGRHTLVFVNQNGVVEHETTLPTALANKQWHHIGLALSADNKNIRVLLNGFTLDAFDASRSLFEMRQGYLTVGQSEQGQHDGGMQSFRGWVDNFKVLAHIPDQEVMCNHALGTLVALEGNAQWQQVANQYPEYAHTEISHTLANNNRPSLHQYACFVDYSQDLGAHLGNIPAGTKGIRESMLFPESPLKFGAPRPDSIENPFCLTCHTRVGKQGLSLQALEEKFFLNAEDDLRRQPMQPVSAVFGNIPAGWIKEGAGPGGPDQSLFAEGEKVDRWVLKHDD